MTVKTQSAKHSKRKQVAQELYGFPLLGEILTWSPGTGNTHTKLVQALKDAGLDDKHARELTAESAFTRASRLLEEERLINVLSTDKDEIRFQFTKMVIGKDGGESEWQFKKETTLRLNKTTGKITCKIPALCQKAQEQLDRCKEMRTGADVSVVVQRLFRNHADLFAVRDQGGVYFVPAEHTAFVSQVESFLTNLGGHINRFPVPKGTKSGDAAVQSTIRESMEQLIEDHKIAIQGLSIFTQQGKLEVAAERINETKVKIEAYAHYLGGERDNLLKEVAAAEKELRQQVAEISKAKKDVEKDGPAGKDAFGFRQGTRAAAINAAVTVKPQTIKELMGAAGVVNDAGLTNHMKKLIDRGFVAKTSDNRFALVNGSKE